MRNSPTPTRALVLLSLVAMLSYSTPASSTVVVPFTPANQLSTVVTVNAHQEPSGTWSYAYTIVNNSSSLQKAWLFALEVAGDPTDVSSPEGWTFVRDQNSATVSWAATEVVPLAPGEDDDGSLPLSLYAIPPGGTQSGFGFRSIYPPAQVRYWIQGETPIPVVVGDDDIEIGAADLEHNSYSSFTQGAVVPATCLGATDVSPCDDGVFCNGSDACLDQECSLHEGDPCPGPDGDGDCSESCDELENDCTGYDLIAFYCDDSNPCSSVSLCDGSGGCAPFNPTAAGAMCRSAAGACDLVELCTGESADCPADVQASSGTPCSIGGGNPCAVGQCNGVGDCIEAPGNAGALCRPSQGGCDIAETCTGTSTTCPVDAFLAASTVCRSSNGICDLEERCTGSAATCPSNAFASSSTTCRAAVGVCDAQETCTGTSASCPSNAFLASGTVCRASTVICDAQETCTGSSASCPADVFASSAVTCRATAGVCDVAEKCTGTSSSCPVDVLLPSTSSCRASAGVCDAAERCSGTSAACPSDQFLGASVVCRASQGECDTAENCSGSAATCPDSVGSVCVPDCPPSPLDVTLCDQFENGELTLRTETPEKKRLHFRGWEAPEMDASELGNPQYQYDETRYLFCAYNSGSLISRIASDEPPSGCQRTPTTTVQCWSPLPEFYRRLEYRDRARDPQNGLSTASFNVKRQSKMSVTGRGTYLQILLPNLDLAPLANSSAVKFQVIRTNGNQLARCWHVDLPHTDKSTAMRFTAKSN
jgi:hypothetical protein